MATKHDFYAACHVRCSAVAQVHHGALNRSRELVVGLPSPNGNRAPRRAVHSARLRSSDEPLTKHRPDLRNRGANSFKKRATAQEIPRCVIPAAFAYTE